MVTTFHLNKVHLRPACKSTVLILRIVQFVNGLGHQTNILFVNGFLPPTLGRLNPTHSLMRSV